MTNALIIYATRTGIGFFEKEIKAFSQKYSIRRLSLEMNNITSRINILRKLPNDSLVIIIAHGRSDAVIVQSPFRDYENKVFIDRDNIDAITNKKVVCITCNSKDQLADLAIANKVKAWAGLGDIDFSQFFEARDCHKRDVKVVNNAKFYFRHIIISALSKTIDIDGSFADLRDNLIAECNFTIMSLKDSPRFLSVQRCQAIKDFLEQIKHDFSIRGNSGKKLSGT